MQGHHQNQAQERQHSGWIPDVPEGDQSVRVAHHQAGIAKADECDKQADAAGHRGVKFVGNGMQNHLPDAGRSERQEDHARKEDRSQSRLPGDVHFEANCVGEVGVQAHPRSQSDGVPGHYAHEDGAEGRRQAGGGGDGGQRHPGGRQNRRIDQDNVGHGQKSGDAGQNLGAPVGSQAREFKITFESFEHRRVFLGDHTVAAMQSYLWDQGQRTCPFP